MTVTDEFLAALPAGEWSDVRVLNGADLVGMMAQNNLAILAEATALRHGGQRAFLKCIITAAPAAGAEAKLLTARERLDRIRARLEGLRVPRSAIPVVRILECRFLVGFDGLLVAMEKVTTLDRVIESGSAGPQLALQVLRELRATDDSWHHFDVCPRNVARTDDGRLVYIDVESLFVATATLFDVSAGIGKVCRWPVGMKQALIAELTANNHRIGAGVAGAKQRFDLALLAAECCLGTFDTLPQIGVTEQWLDQLIASAGPESREMATFWAEQLRPAVAQNKALDLEAIAERLHALTTGNSVAAAATASRAPTQVTKTTTPKSGTSADAPDRVVSDFDDAWQALAPTTRALRREALGKVALQDYKEQLRVLVQKYPQRAEVWNELLLVLISYDSDPSEALRVADEAAGYLPANAELQRTREMVKMWTVG